LWDISLLLQTFWTLFLRLFSARRLGTFDVNWKPETTGDMLPNAHRTQSSAD
jgi:hypothetical protein